MKSLVSSLDSIRLDDSLLHDTSGVKLHPRLALQSVVFTLTPQDEAKTNTFALVTLSSSGGNASKTKPPLCVERRRKQSKFDFKSHDVDNKADKVNPGTP